MSEDLKELTQAIGKQTDALVAMMAKERAEPLHTKAPANFQTATPLHGLGGIFSGQGIERDVITAHVRPRGILSMLPRFPSVSEDPTFATLTGYTDVNGAEPTTSCEDAPTGYVKGCNLTARFGLVRRDTQTIEMDKMMLRINRGDFKDLVLRGSVLGLQGLTPSGIDQTQILNLVTMSEMVGTAVQAERKLNTDTWQGTVAAGTFPGLDSQIATGQVDADTNTACPALDSDVKDFAYNDVCGNTLDIVEYVSMMQWYLQWNAESMGLDPVVWAVAMRPNLWYELSACWPCKYMTNRCLTSNVGANVAVINDNVNISERDRIRREMVLPINGVEIPIITDTGIYESNSTNNANLQPGQFASSLYFVPMTITGGFPVTYLEYIDYRATQPDISLLPAGMPEFFWSDNGLWSWAYEGNKWCFKMNLKIEPRVVLRTPQLAGKIQNIRYTPLQHLREPDPDSPYFQDGGVSLRTSGTRYAVWASGGVR